MAILIQEAKVSFRIGAPNPTPLKASVDNMEQVEFAGTAFVIDNKLGQCFRTVRNHWTHRLVDNQIALPDLARSFALCSL